MLIKSYNKNNLNIHIINLKIENIVYLAIVVIIANHFTIYFLNNRCNIDYIVNYIEENDDNYMNIILYNSFIEIQFNKFDTLKATLDIMTIKNMTKLETIMYILETVYTHFCYKEIDLIDVAEFKCGNLNTLKCYLQEEENPRNMYNSLIYRILTTDLKISQLSIYAKYGFKCNIDNETEIILDSKLNFIRQYQIKNFILLLINLEIISSKLNKEFSFKNELNFIINELKKIDENITLTEFYKSLVQNYNCNEYVIFYKLYQSYIFKDLIKIVMKNKKIDIKKELTADNIEFIENLDQILNKISNLKKIIKYL